MTSRRRPTERTADELGGDEDNAISGFGHSVASLMRQLAGGLRERDVDEFARELAALARRNPGVFLAGSVALGFGIARFFKARAPQSPEMRGDWLSDDSSTRQSTRGERRFDDEESLDLSANSLERREASQAPAAQRGSSQGAGSSPSSRASQSDSAARDDERDQSASKSRQSTKQKAKAQRASSGDSQHSASSNEEPKTDPAGGAKDSSFTGGTGGGSLRGGKS